MALAKKVNQEILEIIKLCTWIWTTKHTMAKLTPSALVCVRSTACTEEDCNALTWRFRACTVGHRPILSHGADRVRYDLPVGRSLQEKLIQAFPGTHGVSAVGHLYQTSTQGASSTIPHMFHPVDLAVSESADADAVDVDVDAMEFVTTTHKIVVFLTTNNGGAFHFGSTTVQPFKGAAVRFKHGVPFSSDALDGTSDQTMVIMLLQSW